MGFKCTDLVIRTPLVVFRSPTAAFVSNRNLVGSSAKRSAEVRYLREVETTRRSPKKGRKRNACWRRSRNYTGGEEGQPDFRSTKRNTFCTAKPDIYFSCAHYGQILNSPRPRGTDVMSRITTRFQVCQPISWRGHYVHVLGNFINPQTLV